MRLPWKRLTAFGALQLFGVLAPLAALPVVIRLIGTSGWVALSLGYAIGAAAAVGVNFGWQVAGPSRVAGEPHSVSARVFVESLFVRVGIAIPALGVAATASMLLAAPSHRTLAGLMAIAMAVNGLTSNWYYIGKGKPDGIWKYESLPKFLATAATIPIVYFTRVPTLYPILLLAATVIGVVFSSREIIGNYTGPLRPEPGLSERIRSYGLLAAAAVLGAGYTNLAVPITQTAGASLNDVANFSGGMRLRSMTQLATAAWTTALQGWVSEPRVRAAALQRMRVALVSTTAIGCGTALLVFVTGPYLGRLIFGNAATISFTLSGLTGLACVPQAIASSLSFHVLAPLGKAPVVAISRMVATVIGVPAIFWMSRVGGAEGASLAILMAETAVAGIQAIAAYRALRGARAEFSLSAAD